MDSLMGFVMPIQSALPSKTCKSIIEKFEAAKADWVNRDTDYFKFNELNIHQHGGFEEEIGVVQRSAEHVLKFYKKELGIKYFPEEYRLEEFRVKKYDPNDEHQFDWHVDVGDHASARRFMVCFFYLNDVEEGGETAFGWEEDEVNPITSLPYEGTALLFPPMWMFPHKGRKPISGPKYIISTYAHYL